MILTNMISFKQTDAKGKTHAIDHSQYELNKYPGVPWKQPSISKSNVIFGEAPKKRSSVVIT